MPREHTEGEINSAWVSQESPLRGDGFNCGTEESIDVYQVEIQRGERESVLTDNCKYQGLGILTPSIPALDQALGAPHQESTLVLVSVH